MRLLNNGKYPGYALDFEFLAEAEARRQRDASPQPPHYHVGRGFRDCKECQFSNMFNGRHILPAPQQWLRGIKI